MRRFISSKIRTLHVNALRIIALLLLSSMAIAGATDQPRANLEDNIQPAPTPEISAKKITNSDAKRFLARATFGPTKTDIAALQEKGYEQWLDEQIAMPIQQRQLNRTIALALMAEPAEQHFAANGFMGPQSSPTWVYQTSAWWEAALTSPDQLRQRVAYALSQILVISTAAEPYLRDRAEGVAAYNDLLLEHAFGNYRELLSAVTYSPAMGVFLSHHGNRKSDPKKGTSPDENYARELMQLFSLGLYHVNNDGTAKLKTTPENTSEPIPVYTQTDVMELARVFTGWDMVANPNFGNRGNKTGNLTVPMEFNKDFHDFGEKTLLGKTIPANLSGKEDVEAALDIIFAQPEVAVFVSKQLIQRLVTSNPSPEYIARIANAFNDNGQGVRGDLAHVVRSILLDPQIQNLEAQNPATQNSVRPVQKLREPVLVVAGLLRALNVQPAKPWVTKHNGKMEGVYWFKKLDIGQNPFMAPSVFNFYESDFQPAGEGFASQDLVAPEAQLLDSQTLIGTYNLINFIFNVRDEQALQLKPEKEQMRLAKQGGRGSINITINTAPYVALLEQANKNNSDKNRAKAIKALIAKLEQDLLVEPLSQESAQTIASYLQKPKSKNKKIEAQRLVSDAARMMLMAPSNWVQR